MKGLLWFTLCQFDVFDVFDVLSPLAGRSKKSGKPIPTSWVMARGKKQSSPCVLVPNGCNSFQSQSKLVIGINRYTSFDWDWYPKWYNNHNWFLTITTDSNPSFNCYTILSWYPGMAGSYCSVPRQICKRWKASLETFVLPCILVLAKISNLVAWFVIQSTSIVTPCKSEKDQHGSDWCYCTCGCPHACPSISLRDCRAPFRLENRCCLPQLAAGGNLMVSGASS